MRRLVVLLAVVGALVLSAGAALADTRAGDPGEGESRVEAELLEMKAASVPTEGLLAPVPTYDGARDKVSYTPSRDLSFGKHTVKVVATDAQGLSATKTWSFSVVR